MGCYYYNDGGQQAEAVSQTTALDGPSYGPQRKGRTRPPPWSRLPGHQSTAISRLHLFPVRRALGCRTGLQHCMLAVKHIGRTSTYDCAINRNHTGIGRGVVAARPFAEGRASITPSPLARARRAAANTSMATVCLMLPSHAVDDSRANGGCVSTICIAAPLKRGVRYYTTAAYVGSQGRQASRLSLAWLATSHTYHVVAVSQSVSQIGDQCNGRATDMAN
jgi:hypothetical protein